MSHAIKKHHNDSSWFPVGSKYYTRDLICDVKLCALAAALRYQSNKVASKTCRKPRWKLMHKTLQSQYFLCFLVFNY